MAMDSTFTLSRATSRAMAARSWVAVTRLSLAAAWSEPAAANRMAANVWNRVRTITNCSFPLERVRSVSAHGKHDLEDQFVSGETFAVAGAAELSANLAELAGPVRQNEGAAGILEQRSGRQRQVAGFGVRVGREARAALRAVEAATQEPAAGELVVAGDVESEWLGKRSAQERRSGGGRVDRGTRPDKLTAGHEGVIDGAAQGLPVKGEVRAEELIAAIGVGAVAARVGTADIDVGGLAQVGVSMEVADGGDVGTGGGAEDVGAVTAEDLGHAFEEDTLGSGQDAAERDAGVVDAILTAHQVLVNQGPVNPGQDVIVQGVDPTEGGAHLANLELKGGGERGKGEVAFLNADALFAEADKKVGAGVWIDYFLEANFTLVHFEAGDLAIGPIAGGADEVADDADIGGQSFGCRRTGATQGHRIWPLKDGQRGGH